DHAAYLSDIGYVYDVQGDLEKALAYYQQALPLMRETRDKRGEAMTLTNLAIVEDSLGRLTDASRHLHDAVMILENIRESLGGLSEAKVSFLESALVSYHAYINLLLKQHAFADAFTWAQKTKARALLDLLFEGKVDVSQVLTQTERERERALKWQVEQANKQLIAETTKQRPDATRVKALKEQLAKAELGTYEIAASGEKLAERAISFRDACASPLGTYQAQGRGLYALLIAPAAKQLAGKRRLIICPDGPLWGVPFQALIAQGSGTGRGHTEAFLIERYEITYAYSATGAQAALLSRDGRGADTKRPVPRGTLLVMASPDFGGERRFGGDGVLGATRDVLLRGERLTLLPGAHREANALKAGFPDAVIYTGQQAQEGRVKQEGGQYRYLHFATHGLLNDVAPLMSSIVLAQPPPGSEEDGFLTAREIFDLKLSAEMVVLSACNTAGGERRGGEGVVGLTWALFVAGAPTQVVSQWAVADESTARLMKQFYIDLRGGKPKGAALRAAALGLMKDGKRKHPFYWAPFVLMGDWR
ncbi:MAG: CHAT domain-containing protein, partial [Abditibacteriales bacterium]|nr:CHAT domain-containing protein [Abditibacteriales bacterium]